MVPTLYTVGDCDESPRVRAWLVERGVAFVERDITDDAEAALALYRTGTFATPLLVVGDTRVLGFRREAIAAALAGNGVPGS